MSSTVLSWILLGLGVVSYGIGGANLAIGSAGGIRQAVRSPDWWLGTGCQALGFGFTLVARRELPLLLVQSCVVGALAITALIQHRTGVKRMAPRDVVAVAAVVAGIASIGAASVPGPAPAPSWKEAVVLAVSTGVIAVTVLVRLQNAAAAVVYGCASGVGFGIMAVAARLLVADAGHPLWIFWRLPLTSWVVGILGCLGLALGQVHLTRGLARGRGVGVLGCMYAMSTVYGALVGELLLGETPKPGSTPYLVVGLLVGFLGAVRLLHQVEEPAALSEA